MVARYQGTTFVGSEASPIALGATGSATDVWTWDHNEGRKPVKVMVLDAVDKGPLDIADVVPTQPTVNQMVVTNLDAAPHNVILEVTWELNTPQNAGELPASVGNLE